MAAVGLALACVPNPYVPGPYDPVPEPDPSEVAAVVFLVGDAGDWPRERAPLLHRLRADVEAWSAAAPADASVAVLYLGDNVYPVGVRDRSDARFPADSARLHGQVWAVTGPDARRRRTSTHFLPGNHDWGNMPGPEGVARLRNMDALLADLAGPGASVRMTPAPGDPGPAVVDVADAVRLVLLDTEWWLQADDADRKDEVVARLSAALLDAGGRPTVVAGHHPLATGGPHGGYVVDPFYLLRRSGAVVQDVNAAPYQEMRAALARAFRESERPLVYAAGHDHSLQVLRTAGPGAPAWTLVSGAGSKLSPVGAAPDMEWADERPGYMRLVVRTDGRVDLFVEAASAEVRACEGPAPASCVEAGAAAFGTAFSVRLR